MCAMCQRTQRDMLAPFLLISLLFAILLSVDCTLQQTTIAIPTTTADDATV